MNSRYGGIVLAGGSSTRMGVDKAQIAVDGMPMLDRVVQTLSLVCDDVVVVGGERTRTDVRCIADRYPGEGPLGGIVTAMDDISAERLVVVACDLPMLDVATIRTLQEGLDRSGTALAVPLVEGRRQWLCAAWQRCALDVLRTRFIEGERSIHRAVHGLSETVIIPRDSTPLIDIDTPEELAERPQYPT